MNPVSRALMFLVSSIAAAGLHARGVLDAWERRIHDGLIRLASRSDDRAAYPIAAFSVDPSDAARGLTRDDVIAALKLLARIRLATAVIAAPDPPPDDLLLGSRAIASAMTQIGRTVFVLGRGEGRAPEDARLVREGRGPALADAPGAAESPMVKPFIESATRIAIEDVEPDADGVVREFAIAYGAHDATSPSLPVAIAACVLKESSLRFSSDLTTLESFGGRDIAVAAPNTLRFPLHRDRVYAPRPLTADALDRIAVHSDARDARFPVVLVAFRGSALLREMETTLGDRRTGLELVADAVCSLLDDSTAHELPWRGSRAVVVGVPLLVGAAPVFAPRRRRAPLATLLAVSYALIVCGSALAFTLLLPVAGVVVGLGLGLVVLALYRPKTG